MSIPPIGERINPMDVVTGWRVNGGQAKGKKLGHPASAFMTNQGVLDTHTLDDGGRGSGKEKEEKKIGTIIRTAREKTAKRRNKELHEHTHKRKKNKGERSQCETVP